MVSAGKDKQIISWDLQSFKEIKRYNANSIKIEPLSVKVTQNQEKTVIHFENNTIQVLDFQTLNVLKTFIFGSMKRKFINYAIFDSKKYFFCENSLIKFIDLEEKDKKLAVVSPPIIPNPIEIKRNFFSRSPEILNCVLSSQDQDILIFSKENLIYIYNYRKNQLIREIAKSKKKIKTLAISKNNILISADEENHIIFWSLINYDEIVSERIQRISQEVNENYSSTLTATKSLNNFLFVRTDGDIGYCNFNDCRTFELATKVQKINCIACFLDNKIAAGGVEKTIYLWSKFSKERAELEGHTSPVIKIFENCIPSLRMLSASEKEIIIWDLWKKNVSKIIIVDREVFFLDFDFYFKANSSTITICDLEGTDIGHLEIPGRANSEQIFNTFNKIAYIDEENRINIWELADSKSYSIDLNEISDLEIPTLAIDDSKIATILGEYFYHWDIYSGTLLNTEKILKKGEIIKISPKLSSLVISNDKKISFRGEKADKFYSMYLDQKITCISFWLEEYIFFGTKSSSINFLRLSDWNCRIVGKNLHGIAAILTIAISKDGTIFLTGSEDNTIRVWNYALPVEDESKKDDGFSKIGELTGHEEGVHILRFIESNADFAVSAGLDKKIGVWNIKEMKLIKKFLVGHSEKITDLVVSHDSKQIISSSMDKSLIFWDFNSLSKIESVKFKDKYITLLTITSDSANIFCADSTGKITKWDTKTRKILPFSLKGPFSYTFKECWLTLNNEKIIVLDFNDTLMVWDFHTNNNCLSLKLRNITAYCMSFNIESFLFASKPTKIQELNLSTGKISEIFADNEINNNEVFIKCLIASFDNSVMVSMSSDGFLTFWRKEKLIKIYLGSNYILNSANFIEQNICLIDISLAEQNLKLIKIIHMSSQKENKEIFSLKGDLISQLYLEKDKVMMISSKNGLELWDLSDANDEIISKRSVLSSYNSICQLKLLKNNQFHTKVISIGHRLSIWNVSLEICCFSLKIDNDDSPRILQTPSCDNFIISNLNLISEKNESIITHFSQLYDAFVDLENNKIISQKILYEEDKQIKKSPFLSGFDALLFISNLKNFMFNLKIEEAIKKNIILPPFNFNFLHIGAILENFREISNYQYDWPEFENIKAPIYPFNSEDFLGRTCLEIVMKKKDKTLLKHFLEVLFRAFENDFDTEYNNHFYQMLKFYSCNFKPTSSFFNFMNQLIEIFNEDTKALGRFFDFMFIEVNESLFNVISDFELEKPVLLITNKFGWLEDKEQVLGKIKKVEEGGTFSCFKKPEIKEKKADILCKIFLSKGLTDISEGSLQFWENLLTIDPENKIFDNQNLNILVQYKWSSYIRSYYLKDFAGYLIFFFIYLTNFIYLVPNRVMEENLTPSEIISIILNIADVIYFLVYTYEEFRQGQIMGISRYFSSFWNLVDVMVFLGVISTSILDILYIFWEESSPYSVKILISISLLFLWARLLSYAKGFEGTGFLIRLVEQVIRDMKFFLMFIFLIMLAFASAGFVLQTSSNESQFSVFNLIYRLMLGDFTNFDEYIDYQENYIPLWFGMILFTIFLSIIMLNLLISIIGDTYGKVVAAEKSNRTYEMLTVIYEIEKFKIFGREEYNKLKERSIFGDYLVCFHNSSHFQKNVESLENHLKENQELKEKINQISTEIKNDANEKFQTLSKNAEKFQENTNKTLKMIQEKIEKVEKNEQMKEKMDNFEQKIGNFEERFAKFEEKNCKVDEKIDSMMENYFKIQNILMEIKQQTQPKGKK